MSENAIAVVGLGYVGLPLALAFARQFRTTGFDINAQRIAKLRQGTDVTGEVPFEVLNASSIALTSNLEDLRGHNVFIITVPTPVDSANRPDLQAVMSACEAVAKVITRGSVVVLESTVYPGVTEDICGPAISRISGLVAGKDFFMGYSPERINPGDRHHTVDKITKVVAGQTPAITERLAAIYGCITTGGVFPARSIRVAEAAKVIENAQRDINIAFVNEVALIFGRLGISIYDVLDAARTKWNFLNFTPGLVGGHCIGVDPYYLADVAQRVGHHPEIILAGRRINDSMAAHIATKIAQQMALKRPTNGRILVLGLSFKENVPDLRNSKVADLVRALREWHHQVDVHDPLVDRDEACHEYGIDVHSSLDGLDAYDCLIGAVAHNEYTQFSAENLSSLVTRGGLIADLKSMWRRLKLPASIDYWTL